MVRCWRTRPNGANVSMNVQSSARHDSMPCAVRDMKKQWIPKIKIFRISSVMVENHKHDSTDAECDICSEIGEHVSNHGVCQERTTMDSHKKIVVCCQFWLTRSSHSTVVMTFIGSCSTLRSFDPLHPPMSRRCPLPPSNLGADADTISAKIDMNLIQKQTQITS